MSIKHILVALTGEGDAHHVPLCALKLAERLSAHVTATDTVGEPAIYIDPNGVGMSPTYYEEIQRVLDHAQTEKRRRARKAFDEAMAVAKVPVVDKPTCHAASAYWVDGRGFDGEVVSALGRLSDLIVVDRPGEKNELPGMEVVETALFTVRRPVLVLPHGMHHVGKHAAVAWNGSAEAANAARAAVELLESGSKVTIIQIGEADADMPSNEALAEYFGWHCIETAIRVVPDQPKATAQLILNAAKAAGAEMLIMGAYTHSRLRELVLGGVTAYMLKKADLPVLMMH